MAWLRDIAVGVFTERNEALGDMVFVAFDVLKFDGQSVMREPWRDRRKRLEDLFNGPPLPRVGIVPVTDDGRSALRVVDRHGRRGDVLKDPAPLYRPDERSPAWLKLKPKLTLQVIATGGSARRVRLGKAGARW